MKALKTNSTSAVICISAFFAVVLMASAADFPGKKLQPDAPAIATATAAAESAPVVICAAIQEGEAPRGMIINSAPSLPQGPVDLVILGTSQPLNLRKGQDEVYELHVEKVLYGSIPQDRAHSPFPPTVELLTEHQANHF